MADVVGVVRGARGNRDWGDLSELLMRGWRVLQNIARHAGIRAGILPYFKIAGVASLSGNPSPIRGSG